MSQDQTRDYFSGYAASTFVGGYGKTPVPQDKKRQSVECRAGMDEVWRFYADQNMVDAARKGFRTDMVRWLEEGADPDAISYAAGYIGVPALFAARLPGCVRGLLMWGASPTTVWQGTPCILHHLRKGHTATIEVIAEYLPPHVLTALRPRAIAIIDRLVERRAYDSVNMGRKIFGIGLGD